MTLNIGTVKKRWTNRNKLCLEKVVMNRSVIKEKKRSKSEKKQNDKSKLN